MPALKVERISQTLEPHLHHSRTYGSCDDIGCTEDQCVIDAPLRAIDVITELEWLLVGKAAYGQPGTDGSFSSNLIKVIQNENEILSLVYVNPQHPFSSSERACALFLGFGINCIANNYLYHDPVWSQFPLESSVYVAILMSVVNFVLRFVLEKRCFIGYHVVSDDIKGDAQKVGAVECLELVTILGGIVIAIGGVGLLTTALADYPGDIYRYFASQMISSLVLSSLFLIPFQLGLFSFMTASGYVNDRYEFEKKWCDFQLPAPETQTMELIKPVSISDVAHAVETRTTDGLKNLNFHVIEKKNAAETKAFWDRIFCFNQEESSDAPWLVSLVNWLVARIPYIGSLDDYFEEKYKQFLSDKGERAPFNRCKIDRESGTVIVKPLAPSPPLRGSPELELKEI